MSVKQTLTKSIADLEAKGALRTKHEDITLENNKVKLKAIERAKQGAK